MSNLLRPLKKNYYCLTVNCTSQWPKSPEGTTLSRNNSTQPNARNGNKTNPKWINIKQASSEEEQIPLRE